MRIYFAGADANPKYEPILHAEGVDSKLESYYSLGGKAPSTTGFKNYLLDSGGFVARTKGIKISVQEYAIYISKHNVKYAFNLDTNDTHETLQNQKYLELNTSAYILPIYHTSDWIKHDYLIDKFIADGYDYIALGGMAFAGNGQNVEHQFLNHCFNKTKDKVKIHGLGKTSRAGLERFPFFSVDSTSWLSAARYGNSISKDKYINKMRARKYHYLDNTRKEVRLWVELEKEVTALWTRRGVKWE